MTEHAGVRVVDSQLLNADYAQLVAELGTAIANKPVLPAATTGPVTSTSQSRKL